MRSDNIEVVTYLRIRHSFKNVPDNDYGFEPRFNHALVPRIRVVHVFTFQHIFSILLRS
jgi:hypothetical protein